MTRLGYPPPAPGEDIDEWSRKVTNNIFAELATNLARSELAAYLQQQQQQEQERAQQEAASAMQEQKEARTSPAGGTLIRRELVVVLQVGVANGGGRNRLGCAPHAVQLPVIPRHQIRRMRGLMPRLLPAALQAKCNLLPSDDDWPASQLNTAVSCRIHMQPGWQLGCWACRMQPRYAPAALSAR